jgi:hypothetical protein
MFYILFPSRDEGRFSSVSSLLGGICWQIQLLNDAFVVAAVVSFPCYDDEKMDWTRHHLVARMLILRSFVVAVSAASVAAFVVAAAAAVAASVAAFVVAFAAASVAAS